MTDGAVNCPSSAELIAEIAREFPGFRLVPKRTSRFSVAIDWALKLVTLGAQRAYLTRYHTVIGKTLYTPDTWATTAEIDRVIVLRHERIHLRQRRRYGLPLMAFLYFVPFFPLGLAYGRARLEWEAYAETLRATAELCGIDRARDAALRAGIVKRFTGGDYGWMWPFRGQVERWYDGVLAELKTRVAP
ncbi:MAG TPA: hypothetical protein VMI54_00915 [Polyangiaceae bacterium]|nr:hypothetical protein [Polyangiaceae bacterium]